MVLTSFQQATSPMLPFKLLIKEKKGLGQDTEINESLKKNKILHLKLEGEAISLKEDKWGKWFSLGEDESTCIFQDAQPFPWQEQAFSQGT